MNHSKTRTRTTEFLQRMEQERVSRVCMQVIDLRGKVPGECFPFSIDDRTHWLDDRSTLWLKELLSAADGVFTVGVFESLSARLAEARRNEQSRRSHTRDSAPDAEASAAVEVVSPALKFTRRESRLIRTIPVSLNVEGLSFHGSTQDISVNALKVVCRRVFTLERGDPLTVDFSDLYAAEGVDCLLGVKYRVLRLEHTEQITALVLTCEVDENPEFVIWMSRWIEQLDEAGSRINLDDRLCAWNLERFQRLYCRNLGFPVIWSSHNSVLRVYGGGAALSAWNMDGCEGQSADLLLGRFSDLLCRQQKTAILIAYCWREDDRVFLLTHAECAHNPIGSMIKWLRNRQDWRIVLLASRPVRLHPATRTAENESVADPAATDAAEVEKIGFAIDISAIFRNIALESADCTGLPRVEPLSPAPVAGVRRFDFNVQRMEQRYLVKTSVSLALADGDSIETRTVDVSVAGVRLCVPAGTRVQAGDTVRVSYLRWNRLVKKVDLTGLPYRVARVTGNGDEMMLGLALNTGRAGAPVNAFLANTIRQYQDDFASCSEDRADEFSAVVFSGLLADNLIGMPFFLGRSEGGERIMRALLASPGNQGIARRLTIGDGAPDWSVLQKLAPRMGAAIPRSAAGSGGSRTLRFGIYCHTVITAKGIEWRCSTDLDLQYGGDKAALIRRALQSPHYGFFHCTLTPLDPSDDPGWADELNALAGNLPHKIKALQKKFNGLFALGELTDVTRVIEAMRM